MKSNITRINKFIIVLLLTIVSVNNIYVIDNYNIIINVILFLNGIHLVLNTTYIYEFYKLNSIANILFKNKDTSNILLETIIELIDANIKERSFFSLLGLYSNMLLLSTFILSPSNLIILIVLVMLIITSINFIQENIYINNKYKPNNN